MLPPFLRVGLSPPVLGTAVAQDEAHGEEGYFSGDSLPGESVRHFLKRVSALNFGCVRPGTMDPVTFPVHFACSFPRRPECGLPLCLLQFSPVFSPPFAPAAPGRSPPPPAP